MVPRSLREGYLHQDFHQEPVELGFGKRISPFHFDGVLGRHDQERRLQLMGRRTAGNGMLLHGFEQRGLSLGCRAIDFVGQHEMREDRPSLESEGFGAAFGIDNHAADDVGGHQVRRELDARVLQMHHSRERPQKRGFTQSGYAFEQHMAARQQTDQYAIDDFLLADDDFSDFFADPVELRGGKLESGVGLHGNILHQASRLGLARHL